MKKVHKLCYIHEPWAYFTTLPVTGRGRITGDDWNDAPYDCNAGSPYIENDENMVKIAYESELSTPAGYHYNAPYCIDQINSGFVPWLCDYYGKTGVKIMAGCELDEFIEIIRGNGGKIYLEGE